MMQLPVTEAMQNAFINGDDTECRLIAETIATTFNLNPNEVYMFLVNMWAYVAGYAQEKSNN